MPDSLAVLTLAAAVRAGTPLLLATLGEVMAERAGVLNLGLEGLMLTGALAGFAAYHGSGSFVLGCLAAMGAAGLLSLLFAFLTITLRTDQVVTGLALTLFGTGLAGFYGKPLVGVAGGAGMPDAPVPFLSSVPILGRALFSHDALVYISFLLVPAAWLFLFRTRAGLELRAAGESPRTADSAGIDVVKLRYIYVAAGGVLAGLGGAYLSLVHTPGWIENMSGGRGWIAVALVIFSQWNPLGAALGAYLFGGVDALQLRIQAAGSSVPPHLLLMLPYVLTIFVLLFASGKALRRRIGAPAALGTPYRREDRV
jgi:simple sugar transport system permease protein